MKKSSLKAAGIVFLGTLASMAAVALIDRFTGGAVTSAMNAIRGSGGTA